MLWKTFIKWKKVSWAENLDAFDLSELLFLEKTGWSR